MSLRDLPATIVDVLGCGRAFALSRRLAGPVLEGAVALAGAAPSHRGQALAEVVPLDLLDPDPAQLLKPRWPLAALDAEGWTYIRREGNVREELFHLSEDPRETRNLARDPANQLTVEALRAALGRLTNGPLTPDRFKP